MSIRLSRVLVAVSELRRGDGGKHEARPEPLGQSREQTRAEVGNESLLLQAGRRELVAPELRVRRLGLRELQPSGFRVTLASAEPGALAVLVIGFTQPALPFFDLSLLGFSASYLYPQPDVLGWFQAGTAWPNVGYVAHDFPVSLVDAGTPGVLTAYLQWIVFGSGATWPGGVSEAMRIHVR